MNGRVEISPDENSLAEFVADWLIAQMQASTGDFRLVLSGGSTPRRLYGLLGVERRDHVPWHRLHLYWGDERFVPHTDPESNYGMTFDAMLRGTPISPDRLHPIPVTGTPAEAAARYEALLQSHYGADTFDPGRPLFDVILLGLGGDGHTCSLCPGSPALDEEARWVTVAERERPQPRITLTYPALRSSRYVAFLVTGAGKQPALLGALAGDVALPAARVRSEGEIIWFLDRPAAGPLYHP
ncbi:MAG: 6-phosphogluconolactonase [Stellaceae bacterium]